MNFSFFLENEEATKRFGEDFALSLKTGDLITLQGDLGAAKSTLARAIIRTLADDALMDVPSPTFTLVQTYELNRNTVTHADLYRISIPEEIDELDFDQALKDGVLLVEWPEKAEGLLGEAAFQIILHHEKRNNRDGRRIDIVANMIAGKRLERSMKIRDFLVQHERGDMARRFFTGDASARSYEILKDTKGAIEILMDAPEMEMPESSGPTYADIAHLATDIHQFVGTDMLIRDNGFVAPNIAAFDLENGLLITDDLGRDGILDGLRKPIVERYIACGQLLSDFHQKDWPQHKDFGNFQLTIPNYDKSVMRAEVSLLADWYLNHVNKPLMSADVRKDFFEAWEPYFDIVENAEKTFIMRDYHSPNIIWRDEKVGNERIGLLDFQDGQMGATAYDVVSLSQDARVRITPELEHQILNAYCKARLGAKRDFNEEAFRLSYAIFGAQRVSKILGIFVRLNVRDNKPHYLQHLPHMQDYLSRNLSHPKLKTLHDFYVKAGLIEGEK